MPANEPTGRTTPRTDAFQQTDDKDEERYLDFSRTLERELIALNKAHDEAYMLGTGQAVELDRLTLRCTALEQALAGVLDRIVTERDGLVGGPLAIDGSRLELHKAEELFALLTPKSSP
jgi:hypothetical protein